MKRNHVKYPLFTRGLSFKVKSLKTFPGSMLLLDSDFQEKALISDSSETRGNSS